MKLRFLALTAWVALGAAAAQPAGSPTLERFLSGCNADIKNCRLALGDYITNGANNKLICLPSSTTQDGAVAALLAWLRAAQDKPDLAGGSADDAQWAGVNALWPCKP